MSNVQTISQAGAGYNPLTAEQHEFASKNLLITLKENVTYLSYGKKAPISPNEGHTISWRRFNMPTEVTTPLTEGTTPDAIDLSIDKVTAIYKEYGAWAKISSLALDTSIDKLLAEWSKLFGMHGGISLDHVVQSVLVSGTNVRYAANVATQGEINTTITYPEILAIVKTMSKNNVPKIKLPNGKMGYICFASPDVCEVIKQIDEWENANKYQSSENIKQGIIGELGGLFFIETNNYTVYEDAGAGDKDVYTNIIIGREAFGVPSIEGKAERPKVLVKRPGAGDTSQPLDMYSTIAWKSLMAVARLNELCILRYECALG